MNKRRLSRYAARRGSLNNGTGREAVHCPELQRLRWIDDFLAKLLLGLNDCLNCNAVGAQARDVVLENDVMLDEHMR